MKYRRFLLIVLCLLGIIKLQSNNQQDAKGYHIEISAPQSAGNYVHLVRYQMGLTLSIDSTKISTDGKASFSSPQKLPEGEYLLFIRPDIQIEMLISEAEQAIRIDVDSENLINSKIEGSSDTELFWKYISFISAKNNELSELQKEAAKAGISDKEKKQWEQKIEKKEKEISDYTASQLKTHANSWYATFLKGTLPIGSPVKKVESTEDVEKNREYIKKHYFDNVSLTDSRFWRTNYFPPQVYSYLSTWVDPSPDSIAAEAVRLVALTSDNEECFKEMLLQLTNNALRSNVMGMENVWTRLAEEYIFDKDVEWIDSTQLAQIQNLYEPLRFNRIGMNAPNLIMQTPDGETISTNDTEANYTVLYFYNPTCSHCKNLTQILRDRIYAKYKDKDLKIIAVNIEKSAEEWNKYINGYNMDEWINCWDPDYKSAYWMYYDVSSVPTIFVLDKDKKIIARKMDENNIERFLEYHIDK